MTICPITLFNSCDDLCRRRVSQKMRIGCGEYMKLTGYCLPEGVCIKINEVFEDVCKCLYFEQPYCVAGGQVGLDCDNPRASIPMPGCYIAEICLPDPCIEFDDEFIVIAEKCTNVENLTTVIHAMECC